MNNEEIKQVIFSILCDNQRPKGKGILVGDFIKIASLVSDKLSGQFDAQVILPSVTIDKEALRFEFEDGGTNLFWKDLFIGQRHSNYQAEVMGNLFKAYNECLKARSK